MKCNEKILREHQSNGVKVSLLCQKNYSGTSKSTLKKSYSVTLQVQEKKLLKWCNEVLLLRYVATLYCWSEQTPTPTARRPLLAGIATSDIRRAVTSRTERTRQTMDQRHPLNGHLKWSQANENQQSVRTRWNRPVRLESGGNPYGTDTANYGPKTPTQWTYRSGVTPEIAEEFFFHQMHWAHQHDGESCSHGENDSSPWTPVCTVTSMLTNTFQLAKRTAGQPARHSNRLRTQVGRSRLNMLKWGYLNEPEMCDCGIRQTM